jgi:phage baseplate assembly protein W
MSELKNFLGRGFNFPVKLDRNGGLAMSAFEENIEQAIEIVIGTAPGERQMRPDFGCRIHDLLFSPANMTTCTQASMYVKESLVMHEPRIKHIEVRAEVDPNADNKLLLSINYTVRASNNHQNMVYPFYLRREEDL